MMSIVHSSAQPGTADCDPVQCALMMGVCALVFSSGSVASLCACVCVCAQPVVRTVSHRMLPIHSNHSWLAFCCAAFLPASLFGAYMSFVCCSQSLTGMPSCLIYCGEHASGLLLAPSSGGPARRGGLLPANDTGYLLFSLSL